MIRLAFVMACACGAATPAAKPAAFDGKALAAELHGEMAELADVAHRTRADCPRMATQLHPVILRMRASVDRAHAAQADPAIAKQLVIELHAYDRDAQGIADAIVADLAACRDDGGVRAVIEAMPTL